MNQKEFVQAVADTYKVALDLVDRKNQDYGRNKDPFKNFQLSVKVGVPVEKGMMIRMMDKVSRIANLLRKKRAAVTDEKIEDTLLDLVNYAAIMRVWITKGKGAKKRGKVAQKKKKK